MLENATVSLRPSTLRFIAAAGAVWLALTLLYCSARPTDPPIEVGDGGSVIIRHDNGFDQTATAKLSIAKSGKSVRSVSIDGKPSIPLRGKSWTIASTNSPVTLTPHDLGNAGSGMDASCQAPGCQFIKDNDTQFHLGDASIKFTPATLTFANDRCPAECDNCSPDQKTCTLTCKGGDAKCMITFDYK